MTTLMVTPYPPYRDGIGAYAVQEVRRMRAEGTQVEVLSPLPSAADHHLALGNTRGVLALVKRARRYDRVILQFSPEMVFGACLPFERPVVWAGLEALARVCRLEIRLHEIEFGPLRRNPAERAAARRALLAATTVAVHTRPEIANLASVLKIDPDQVTLVEHGQNFTMATESTQAEARAELGLDPDVHVFLAIGFLQEHKGFDVAVDAFGRANLAGNASLHVVGSVRLDHPDLVGYAARLGHLCRATPGASLHQKYVSDEEFDRWIVAADTVVLPYREIWSSSVLERAKLYDRTIIAADVGGMGDQAPPGTLFFDDIETLVQALKERAHTTLDRVVDSGRAAAPAPGARSPRTWYLDVERPDRIDIESQVRARARAGRLAAGRTWADSSDAIDPLLSVGPVQRPHAVSARPGVSHLKRLIRRVTDWEIDPIVAKVEALHRATTEAVDQLDSRLGTAASTRRRPERLIEEPFVHAALADLSFGTRVLLADGVESELGRALTAAGHVVTSLSTDLGTAETSRPFDVVVVTSVGLRAAVGAEARWLDDARKLLTEGGRIILSLPYQRLDGGTETPPYDRTDLAELFQGWTIRYVSVGLRSSPTAEWRLEANELVEPSAEERLILLVATP